MHDHYIAWASRYQTFVDCCCNHDLDPYTPPPPKQSSVVYYRNHPVRLSVLCSHCGAITSFPCHIWISFHIIVIHDPRVCHALDPRSYLISQGHSVHLPKICVSPHCLVLIWITFHTIDVHDARVCMTLTQGHISKVKVTVHIYRKSVSRP